MKAVLTYQEDVKAMIHVPCSKSYLHRAMILASCCDEVCTLKGVDFCTDTKVTMDALKNLGANIKYEKDCLYIKKESFLTCKHALLDVKQSGSSLRFLIPFGSALEEGCTFVGDKRLFQRPLSFYEEYYKKNDLTFEKDDTSVFVQGKIEGGDFHVGNLTSSQFITGLLLALPFASCDSRIIFEEEMESFSYIEITLQVLKDVGLHVKHSNNIIYIQGNQTLKPFVMEIEKDMSAAAVFACLGAMKEEAITICNMPQQSLQGDYKIFSYLKDAGASVIYQDGNYIIKKDRDFNVTCDLQNCIDLGPCLFTFGGLKKSGICLKHTNRLVYKESDRLHAMLEELSKCCIRIQEGNNEVNLRNQHAELVEHDFDGHKDHRIIMALCLLVQYFKEPITIQGAQYVNKSFEGFFDELRKCGIRVEEIDEL